MPKAEYFQTNDFGKVLIVISLSTLSLFGTLTVLLPMLWSFMIFIPLWTIYIISRGAKFLKFPENIQMTYTFILCLLIVGIPSVLSWCIGFLLPKQF